MSEALPGALNNLSPIGTASAQEASKSGETVPASPAARTSGLSPVLRPMLAPLLALAYLYRASQEGVQEILKHLPSWTPMGPSASGTAGSPAKPEGGPSDDAPGGSPEAFRPLTIHSSTGPLTPPSASTSPSPPDLNSPVLIKPPPDAYDPSGPKAPASPDRTPASRIQSVARTGFAIPMVAAMVGKMTKEGSGYRRVKEVQPTAVLIGMFKPPEVITRMRNLEGAENLDEWSDAMKNVQIIDGALNCVYDIFSTSDEDFARIFPNGTNVGFIDEIMDRGEKKELDDIFDKMWGNPVIKREANGIHGIIFYELEHKKQYYPNRIDEDAINPSGSRIR